MDKLNKSQSEDNNSFSVIDDGNLRGVIASSSKISKELLEDVVDLIEWSTPEAIDETEKLIAEADRDNSWMSWGEVKESFKKSK